MKKETKNVETKTPPLVFISYSHDSEEHTAWVLRLATALIEVGIAVILDEWDIGPGDELAKFMEQSVRRADRVIMICTEEYVRKVDAGEGGAGYEAMVVTGELVQNLGTRKFIPVVRQSGKKLVLPACVPTRVYVDFSKDESFAKMVEKLARDIHAVPRYEKPALGKNPFTTAPSPTDSEVKTSATEALPAGPLAVYEHALTLADAGEFVKWHALIQAERSDAAAEMLRWKGINGGNFPARKDDLPSYFLPAVATHGGLFAAAFAAFDSSDERFHDQRSLLDLLRRPKDWEQSGANIWVKLPELVLFTYQALLGALALSRRRPGAAYDLALTPMADQYSGEESRALYKNIYFVGWPHSLSTTCTHAWEFLNMAAREWEWLWKIFGSHEETMAALIAYYLFLNTVDFVSATKAGTADGKLRELKPPLFVLKSDDDVQIRAVNLLSDSADFIREMFEENGITNDALPALWKLWMDNCNAWVLGVYRDARFLAYRSASHLDVPRMVALGPKKRLID